VLHGVFQTAQLDWHSRATVTLFDESWHQGVVGLVASRVKEKIHRPVIACACDGEEELKGSGRSIEGIHLRDALDR
ncbi:DHHA1 domain-containing protein, partial [Vibrio cholerae]|uniref:DHHA1 domain-containing protein n=1 Tax=Vibrio cholerae TaxID=666 RepID=UPI00209FF48F